MVRDQDQSGGAPSQSQDFATSQSRPATAPSTSRQQPGDADRPQPHVHYAPSNGLNIDTSLASAAHATRSSKDTPSGRNFARTDSMFSPVMRRRTRAATFKTVEDFEDFEVRPGWRPGAEPGLDPSKADGGHASMPQLSAPCEITIVDYSKDELDVQKFNNETLVPFLKKPQPEWAKCRWINVNGLSWDVIQALGKRLNLHKLSLEDIMNTKNRTKAEWFPTHAFIVLTLQKLVHTLDPDDEDSLSDDGDYYEDGMSVHSGKNKGVSASLRRLFGWENRNASQTIIEAGKGVPPGSLSRGLKPQGTGLSGFTIASEPQTLQRFHASPNEPRTQFMEKHSSLSSRDLAVACEQVSMFITNDNVIISFFELSAAEVEEPIIRRLKTSDTILRHSCDASMTGQAIIDAIIDLAIPVTTCYTEVIGDLELDVLTQPTLDHTKKLYIVITEINKMLSFINPIITLINALRDHKANMTQDDAAIKLQDPTQGVILTPMTYTYLGDVLDHCVLISESLNQLRGSADGMIDLIFNTISAYQNESMKQLTVATIIFLPLTFLTGYFGQNFDNFPNEEISYFWKITAPVVFVVVAVLLKDTIWGFFKSLMRRRYVLRLRKTRPRRRGKKRV
ncbi:hypothetical protein B0H63DRAFT_480969 [Podospora didyma]|uniref:Uncharacterized protein n=1 Tax=Podospora didyma TaxID=330526 RepID=A0AAE0KE20_9PEZI|nr:hypothetical protein B0H63DRAFT_480969 [Podospora didyma]